MVAFEMIVRNEFSDRVPQRIFPKQDHLVQTAFFNRANKAFAYAFASQAGAHFRNDSFKVRRPGLSANPDFGGSDLPDLADCHIDDGFVAPAVWRALRLPDEGRDLRVWNGERQFLRPLLPPSAWAFLSLR
jgi:hypothetical protein